ncbi:hemagglutinin repeat-containing protein [Ectopseudomonas alcaliphila]|uniref:Filamentous hemagglutinin n=1 Tax=Ectopseudomonas alcaliphila TaxID=101564 RepID=A0A1G7B4F7_9GAMM|nr:hemagglutinin repeat-containing protein [Pseudomonas alcaliphila]MDX5993256.1 hemagglutinin repeat-containing protein [Pseudomonas alcaliphila]SDE21911.1 filamentous hemagglutinin [Pseudomonas alcaliphila]
MNKHLHRVIFNKARGLLMVVAENVSSQGKAPGTRDASGAIHGCVATLQPLRFALMGALGLVSLAVTPAWAGGIVADPNAPGGQRPHVIESANGTPQVNIATPSAAGVSRNTYSQFDVDGRGAILNNSPTISQTQIGGWIEGNPNLRSGARVILNEVNSSDPSQLRGYVEVAGRRAEVIIANPAGITCDGCGFINADRSTLTTGRVQMEDGRITGYKVEGGTLSITGKGLDSRDSDYTDLIARSVEVNAGIWAKDLKVTAGRNQVNADNTQVSALADDGSAKPEVAIDVAQLGGMYAGKIKLVGTEAGVGVRNAGQIGAMAGEVVISADGKLQNLGTVSSAGDTQLVSTQAIDNSGSLYAKGDMRLSSQGSIKNNGVVAAQGNTHLQADRVQSGRDSLLAAGIDALGNAKGAAELKIEARQVAANGQNHASGKLDVQGDSLDLSHSRTQAGDLDLSASNGDIDLSASQIDSTGNLQASASGTLRSDAAKVSAEHLALSAKHLSNVDGELLQTGSTASTLKATDSLDNSNGRIASNAESLSLEAQTLNNQGGTVEHAGDGRLALNAQRIEGSGGSLLSNGQLHLTAQQAVLAGGYSQGRQVLIDSRELDNSDGSLLTTEGGTLEVRDAQRLNNKGGTIASNGEVRLTAQELLNEGGELLAGRLLSLNTAYLRGTGKALSLGDLLLRQQSNMNLAGLLQANGKLDVEVDGALNNAAQLQAGQSLLLRSTTLDNASGAELSANQVDLRVDGQLLNRGLVDGQQVRVQADELHNLGTGQLYGDRLAVTSRLLSNRDEAGRAATLAARERLDIGAETLENREQALIFSAGDLAIGGALDANDRASDRAELLSNASATIEALGNLDLAVRELRNTNEHFSTSQVEVSRERQQEYQISSSPNRYRPDQISIHHDEVDHLTTPDGRRDNFNRYDYDRVVTETRVLTSAPGQILAGGNLSFSGESLFNDKSRIIAGGLLQVGAAQVNNTEVEGQRITSDIGSVTNFYRIQRKGRDRQGTNVATYRPAPLIQDIDISPTEFRGQTAVSGSNTQLGVRQSNQVDPGIEVQLNNGQGVAGLVRSGGLNLNLPSNNLFQTNPEGTRGYLIETDPRFASYRRWLSSDYMLQRLSVDPALTQLRLGDGFYEQKLIREQIAQLTGRRFLDGYADDEAQYRALLDNGVTLASEWNLIPGVALTAEQMAQLTSDLVWLVERSVTLANGETRRVLVPQVYMRVRDGDLNGNGALIAGQQLKLDLSGDLLNSGSIGGRSIVAVNARNIDNLGGRLQAAKLVVEARENLNNIGGSMSAVDLLSVNAGNDIRVASTTQDSANAQGSRTALSRVASLFVSGSDGTLQVGAGNDLQLDAAQVANAGQGATLLTAGRDLNLGTLSEAHQQSIVWNSSNWRNEASRTEVGSVIQTTGELQLNAGQDINARGASVNTENGMLLANAGRDINLTEAENYQFADEAHKFKGKSGMFSSTTTTLRDTVEQTLAEGSTFSGEQAYLQAGRDITLRGSNVASTEQTILLADNDIHLDAASDRITERHDKTKKKSGLFSGGGLSLTIGTQQQSVEDDSTRRTAVGSVVGSTDGDVLILADGDYRQVGSHVVAPKGNVDISAQRIDVLEARNLSERERETRFKQSGLSVSITNPVVSAIQTADQMKQASSKTDNSRMQALAVVTTALAANNAATAVAQDPTNAGGINVSISLGTQKSANTVVQRSDTSAASTIAAGNDVSLQASGAGSDSHITVRGSQIKAGNNASLAAGGDINLLAATDSAMQQSDSSGSSASVGIGFSLGGSKNGFSLNLGVSGNRGESDGEDITHSNARVDAGNTLLLQSGRDTNLKGAVATGKQVVANVGRDLNIESLQDTSTYKVDEKSMGVGLSLCIPPFCAGASSISANFGKTDIDSEYASVIEQSGIRAGDGGFQINVGGNTDLVGAVITSSDKASADGRNTLSTATLTTRDIKNEAKYSGSSLSIGGGYGANIGKDQQGNAQAGPEQTPGSTLPNEGGFSATMPVALGAKDETSSVTHSGISAADIEIRDDAGQQTLTGSTAEQTIASLNRDVSTDRDTSNALKPIFNEEELRAGFEIAGAFTREVGTFLDNKAKEADAKKRQAEEAEARALDPNNGLSDEQRLTLLDQSRSLQQEVRRIGDDWGAGGTYRQIATALVAAASGNISAGGGEFAQGMVVNYVQQQGAGYIGKLVAEGSLLEGSPAHAALHAIVACAGAAASNQSCSGGAAGAAASSLLTGLFNETSPDEGLAEREAKRNLIVSLVSGLAAASGADTTSATTAAGTAVDNNWLASQQIVQMNKELEAADGTLETLKVLAKWGYVSRRQDVLTSVGIGKGLAESGWNDIEGLAQFLSDPIAGLSGLKQLISSPDARQELGDSVFRELDAKIDRMTIALEHGGDQNAEQLGKDLGALIWQVGSVVTGVGGIAKGGVKLATAGVKLGKDTLEKMATDGAKLAKAEAVAGDAGKALPSKPTTEPPASTGADVADTGKPAHSPEGKPEPQKADPAPTVVQMDEFVVEPFNPYNSKKFQAMSPAQQKAYLKEYNKQLQAQQDALNNLSLDEYKAARDAYNDVGRNPASVGAQQKFGQDFEIAVRESIAESLMAKGKDFSSATTEAAERAKQIRSELAALHDPDMVAGGWGSPEPVRMGNSVINSSIGASWPSRLKALDEAVDNAIASGGGAAKMNVKLELLRGTSR